MSKSQSRICLKGSVFDFLSDRYVSRGSDLSQTNLPNKVFVVDDDPTVALGLEAPLGKYNIAVVKANALDAALYVFNQTRLDVAIVELDFAPLPGLALIQKWRKHDLAEKRFTGFIALVSSQRTAGQDGLLKELGDIEIVTKPINSIQLLPVISRALQNKMRALQFYETKNKLIDPYIKNGNFPKAIEVVKSKLPELGDKGRTLLLDLYEQSGQSEQALTIINELLKNEPNNIALLNSSGRILMKSGKFDEARAFLEKADGLAPQNIGRINDMATMYLQLKEPDKSVEKFKDLLALHPEQPEIKFDMFSKLYDAGYDQHATDFGKSSAQPMEIVRHYNNKGVLLSKDGKTAEAQTEYDRALKFFPKFRENYRILYNLALSNVNMKTVEKYKKAREYLKRCLELKPDFEKAKTTLATVDKILEKGGDKAASPPAAGAASDKAKAPAKAAEKAPTEVPAAKTPKAS